MHDMSGEPYIMRLEYQSCIIIRFNSFNSWYIREWNILKVSGPPALARVICESSTLLVLSLEEFITSTPLHR